MKTFPVYLSKDSISTLKSALSYSGLEFTENKKLYDYLTKVEKSYDTNYNK